MRYARFGESYFLRLEKGEEVVRVLSDFLRRMDIRAGVISAIGAVCDVTLGYFDLKKKEYAKESFAESFEVASLVGNAAVLGNDHLIHLHANLADRKLGARAGHLFSAKVSVTLEVHIISLEGSMERRKDEETGLNLLAFP